MMFNLFSKSMPDLRKCLEALKIGRNEYYGLTENHPIVLPGSIGDCDSAIYGVLHFFMGCLGKPVEILGVGNHNMGNKSIVSVHFRVDETGLRTAPEYKMYFDVTACEKSSGGYEGNYGPAINLESNPQSQDRDGGVSIGGFTNKKGYRSKIKPGKLGGQKK